jgi:hypothetical protein
MFTEYKKIPQMSFIHSSHDICASTMDHCDIKEYLPSSEGHMVQLLWEDGALFSCPILSFWVECTYLKRTWGNQHIIFDTFMWLPWNFSCVFPNSKCNKSSMYKLWKNTKIIQINIVRTFVNATMYP